MAEEGNSNQTFSTQHSNNIPRRHERKLLDDNALRHSTIDKTELWIILLCLSGEAIQKQLYTKINNL